MCSYTIASLLHIATVYALHISLYIYTYTGTKPGGASAYWERVIGIRTYDLNTDQIINIVESVGPEGEA